MLSQAENELIAQTGPGTPCGELMRRYWQPAALSEELPVGGAPLPIRLLGEDLVLFRSPVPSPLEGRAEHEGSSIGCLAIHCSHRGADLSYGRPEDGGLRCIYHGWLYDRNGRCLEQPGEPAGSAFHEKIRHTAYPCVERAGAIFAYLGPGQPPEFPNYEFLLPWPEESRDVTKRYHECNYLQAIEGNSDTSHLSFLHYLNLPHGGDATANQGTSGALQHRGPRPGLEVMEVERTPYGVRGARHGGWGALSDIYNITEFILPNLGAFSNDTDAVISADAAQPALPGHPGYSVHWHVPIDDTHHWKYTFSFSSRGPLGARYRGRTEMVDYRPVRNLSNRFLQDREEMVDGTYAGLGRDFQLHDKFATESQGPLQDRTAEHLGALDTPLMICREILLKAIRDLQEGLEPANVVRDPQSNHLPIVPVRAIVPLGTEWDWKAHRFGDLPSELAGVGTGAANL
ncbi:MAG TPA: Rieske 2Fe-2S domain-containing protein [Chloroflexota bacterium]